MTTKWPLVPLGEIAEVIAGQSPEGRHYNSDGVGMPFYQGKKHFSDRWIAPAGTWTRESTKVAKKGDILMSVRAPVGPVNLATGKCCVGRGLAAIRPSGRVSTDFLFYYLQSIQEQISGNEGAVFASINKSQIAALRIPLPPLDEQKRIVAKLDEAMGYQTHALLNIVKSGQEVQDLSSALTAEMLIKVGMEYGEDSLGNVFNIARGGSPRPIKDFLTDAPDGVNWIKISDATRTGKYITDTEQKIKPEGISRSRKVFPGDFLLSNSMSFGRPYILETEGCIHDGWLVLSHNEHEFDTEYMYYALGSKYMYDQFNSLAYGSTVRNLNIESASRAIVPLPPLGVQKALAEEFRKIDELVASQQRVNSAKRKALANLNGAILSAAFVGEL